MTRDASTGIHHTGAAVAARPDAPGGRNFSRDEGAGAEAGIAFEVRGLVQGVGFRPFVYRIASQEGLAGDVCNTPDGVTIRAFGAPGALARFRTRLRAEAPPLAAIEAVRERALPAPGPAGFAILPSAGGHGQAAVTPDAAVCADCLAEMADPADRRFRYPFINCTACGPRYSIVAGLPYDRPNTAMAAFAMCADCAREYADHADRRHHAEPIACPRCGPRVVLQDAAGGPLGTGGAAIAGAVRLLGEGRILAIKGIGGFHLAVRAVDARAVAELRRRKRRPAKPFALMVRDLAVAGETAILCRGAREALRSPAAPIVLAPLGAAMPGIAPGLAHVGLMLPYTPLHALLLEKFDEPLVMTSANRSGEPQVIDDAALAERLAGVFDAVLTHDRPILNRIDDSLVAISRGRPQVLRRARGLAPRPIALPAGFAPHPAVLALGGDVKNAFALARDGAVVLSPHIGDLANPVAVADLERSIALASELFGFAAERVVADPHPAYRSHRIAAARAEAAGLPLDHVLHHHTHVAALMVDHGIALDHPPILALALDGLGLGKDGALWGCELIEADYRSMRRLGTLAAAPLLGGNRAALEPWRNLLARLAAAFGPDPHAWPPPLADRLAGRPVETLLAAMAAGINAPDASSAGRLFDAVAAATRLCDRQDYEGEAAMRLEAAAGAHAAAADGAGAYPFALHQGDGPFRIDPAPLWPALAADLAAGCPAGIIAARFHRGFAQALCALVEAARRREHPGTVVALTGGTFQNALLSGLVREGLAVRGLTVLEHRDIPAGDGGLAVGQAAVAIARNFTAERRIA